MSFYSNEKEKYNFFLLLLFKWLLIVVITQLILPIVHSCELNTAQFSPDGKK
jgi:hypothetical protein